MITISVSILTLLLHLSPLIHALPPLFLPSSLLRLNLTNLSTSLSLNTTHAPHLLKLLPPPDPLVLHRSAGGPSPATLALKLHDYGNPNNPTHVKKILELAQTVARMVPANEVITEEGRDLFHYEVEGGMTLDFWPGGGGGSGGAGSGVSEGRITWGQWRLVLECFVEFEEWYRSKDFFFEVKVFEQGRMGKTVGGGVLWTGLRL